MKIRVRSGPVLGGCRHSKDAPGGIAHDSNSGSIFRKLGLLPWLPTAIFPHFFHQLGVSKNRETPQNGW